MLALPSFSSHSPALSTTPPVPDVLALLLDDKRSPETRRAYESDLRDFFQSTLSSEPSPEIVRSFLAQTPPQLALQIAGYKSTLRGHGKSEATINRRLAAIKSLLKFAYRLGYCATDGRGLVDTEKAKSYRDTRGVDLKTLRKLVKLPHENFAKHHACISTNVYIYSANTYIPVAQIKCARDTALLTLLAENALRRAEVVKLNCGDFDPGTRSLWILGKGRGSQKERITLSDGCCAAIGAYLALHGTCEPHEPLFRNLDRRGDVRGQRLTADGLYAIVGEYGRAVGVPNLTPHKLRHSSLTLALDMTNGDVRKVQKLSRHANLKTLQIYDDAREDFQGEMSVGLSKLLSRR
jgi:integrase/recombinase XerC